MPYVFTKLSLKLFGPFKDAGSGPTASWDCPESAGNSLLLACRGKWSEDNEENGEDDDNNKRNKNKKKKKKKKQKQR